MDIHVFSHFQVIFQLQMMPCKYEVDFHVGSHLPVVGDPLRI